LALGFLWGGLHYEERGKHPLPPISGTDAHKVGTDLSNNSSRMAIRRVWFAYDFVIWNEKQIWFGDGLSEEGNGPDGRTFTWGKMHKKPILVDKTSDWSWFFAPGQKFSSGLPYFGELIEVKPEKIQTRLFATFRFFYFNLKNIKKYAKSSLSPRRHFLLQSSIFIGTAFPLLNPIFPFLSRQGKNLHRRRKSWIYLSPQVPWDAPFPNNRWIQLSQVQKISKSSRVLLADMLLRSRS